MNVESIESGDILNCIDCDPWSYITIDKEYVVIDKWYNIVSDHVHGYVRIIDDDNYINSHPINFFESISEKRNRIINEILKV